MFENEIDTSFNFSLKFLSNMIMFWHVIGIKEKQTRCIPKHVAIMQSFITIFVDACKTHITESELKEISKDHSSSIE